MAFAPADGEKLKDFWRKHAPLLSIKDFKPTIFPGIKIGSSMKTSSGRISGSDMKTILPLLFLLVFAQALAFGPVCGAGQGQPSSAPDAKHASASPSYPVTVQNCGATLVFKAPPRRAVTLFGPTTEIMLALGLKDRIVGAAWTRGQPVLPEFETDYRQIYSLSETSSPGREALLSLNPDFVFDNQPDYFYSAANGFATKDELAAMGAQVYSLTANCGPEYAMGDVETIFLDVRNIGRIFNVSEKAEKLVETMRRSIDFALEKTRGVRPITVMVYIDGKGPLDVFGAKSSRYAVFRKLGVKNIFPDLDHGPVSIEEVAVSNADVFVVNGSSYNGTPEERIRFLKKTFPHTPAVKNNRVVVLPYSYMNPGIQNARGVEALARLLYPEAFSDTPCKTDRKTHKVPKPS